MSEKLSEENRALVERTFPGEIFGSGHGWVLTSSDLDRLLTAARAEARPAPAVDREAVALLACQFMNDSGLDWPEASCRDQLTYIDKPHDGDCTKKPYTCLRCCAEDAYRFADAILALLSPVVDREAVALLERTASWIEATIPRLTDLDLRAEAARDADALRALLSPATSPGEGSSSANRAARIASDHAASETLRKSEEG